MNEFYNSHRIGYLKQNIQIYDIIFIQCFIFINN